MPRGTIAPLILEMEPMVCAEFQSAIGKDLPRKFRSTIRSRGTAVHARRCVKLFMQDARLSGCFPEAGCTEQ